MANVFRYDDVPVIETASGKLKGYFCDGAYIFKGIPYAWADRFQMPVPYKWEGVKNVCSYGFVCPLMKQDTPNGELQVPHRYWPMDEHCQNLNIWTKTLDGSEKKPVIVWLHGGAYLAGSSIEQAAYDGYRMCMEGDVVVVSINHRLNVLGYLDMSPFAEKYRNSGNAGNADIVAALQWIHDNISCFGGDPENVTIFGQSGGGTKVADMLQIPAADGLFHKCLIMSGVSSEALLPTSVGNGRQIVEAMLEYLDLTDAEALETIPYHRLAEAYMAVFPGIAAKGGYVGGTPLVNDWYLGAPLLYGLRDEAKKIPMMVGSVFSEFYFSIPTFDKTALTEEQGRKLLEAKFGKHTDVLVKAFREAYPGKNPVDLLQIDRIVRQPTKKLADLHSEGSEAGTYLYNFLLEFPLMHKTAWHCSDIPFFFHNTDKVEVCAIPEVTEKLERQMFGAFMAFARTGKPSHPELPQWPSVTEREEPTMLFDSTCRVADHYDDALLNLMDTVLAPASMAELHESEDVQH